MTRFAPSPTGYLHLGHVVNAIFVWGVARTCGGRVLLRIEDHDRTRCRPSFERAIIEDLDWLGFMPDQGGPPGTARQSDHPARYADALDRLRQSNHVYACQCSRREIGAERYDGRCRDRGLPEFGGYGLRVRVGQGTERFDDLCVGAVEHTPAEQCGDLLVRDRQGQWTYQFAVTVDDLEDEVTLVIRGLDLLTSTGRQIQLARMLGRTRPPVFLHHPLVAAADGRKLSKRDRDTSVREMRDAGLSPAAVIGRAAAAAGLTTTDRPLSAIDLPVLFR